MLDGRLSRHFSPIPINNVCFFIKLSPHINFLRIWSEHWLEIRTPLNLYTIQSRHRLNWVQQFLIHVKNVLFTLTRELNIGGSLSIKISYWEMTKRNIINADAIPLLFLHCKGLCCIVRVIYVEMICCRLVSGGSVFFGLLELNSPTNIDTWSRRHCFGDCDLNR